MFYNNMQFIQHLDILCIDVSSTVSSTFFCNSFTSCNCIIMHFEMENALATSSLMSPQSQFCQSCGLPPQFQCFAGFCGRQLPFALLLQLFCIVSLTLTLTLVHILYSFDVSMGILYFVWGTSCRFAFSSVGE